MTNPMKDMSPSTRGRIAASLSVFLILCGIAAQAVIADSLTVSTDAAKTAANIVANKSLYRLAFSVFMVEMLAQSAMTITFYDLLKPVDKSLARIFAVIGLTGSGIKTFARLFFYAPLILLGGTSYYAAIPPAQLEALALIFIKLNHQAAAIGLIFFGVEGFIRGWLIFKSGFLPRAFGVLSMISGIGWMTYLWPPLGSQLFLPIVLFALAGAFGLAGWLFVKGVDDAKWKERQALAATSIWR
jgi:hypothetical protein